MRSLEAHAVLSGPQSEGCGQACQAAAQGGFLQEVAVHPFLLPTESSGQVCWGPRARAGERVGAPPPSPGQHRWANSLAGLERWVWVWPVQWGCGGWSHLRGPEE